MNELQKFGSFREDIKKQRKLKSIRIKNIPPTDLISICIKQPNILDAIKSNNKNKKPQTDIQSLPSIKLTRNRKKKMKTVIENVVTFQEPVIEMINRAKVADVYRPVNAKNIHNRVKSIVQNMERKENPNKVQNQPILRKINGIKSHVPDIKIREARNKVQNQPILRKLINIKSYVPEIPINDIKIGRKIERPLKKNMFSKTFVQTPEDNLPKAKNISIKEPILRKLNAVSQKTITQKEDIIQVKVKLEKIPRKIRTYSLNIPESIENDIEIDQYILDSDDEMAIKYFN